MSILSLEIRDKVELLSDQDFQDLVQIYIKVEQQILRIGSRSSYSYSYPRKGLKGRAKPPRDSRSPSLAKEKFQKKDEHVASTRTSDIKRFKCHDRGHVKAQSPCKRTILMRGHEIYSGEDEAACESVSEDSDGINSEDAYACEGDLLMICRTLNNQSSPQPESYRENIFHTRCKILENTCSLIIDNELCCNCCSTRLVEKLNLIVVSHPKPYKFHWLNEDGDIHVKNQVRFKFSVGNYEDIVLCDVFSMEACHVLFGKP